MKTKLLTILLIAMVYVQVRQVAWSELVAKNYMIWNHLDIQCRRQVLYNNRLPIIERVIGISPPLKPGETSDTSKCDKLEAHKKVYQASWERYHKWYALGFILDRF